MTSIYLPAIQEIHDAFADEIRSLGGVVSDVFNDEERLFARAILGADAEVRPGDIHKPGVAVRAVGPEILVRPYVFRQVCANGAIIAHALPAQRLERLQSTEMSFPTYDSVIVLSALREAIRACSAPDVFTAATDELRSTVNDQADRELQMLPFLARLPRHMATHVAFQIRARFAAGSDRSAFGLVNAVTSVARDTYDPEARWSLEELGGTIPARLVSQPTTATSVPAARV